MKKAFNKDDPFANAITGTELLKMKFFKVGDKVCWTSQAGGFEKKKHGVVREIVPAGARPLNAGLAKRSGLARTHESYVVRVKGRLYWPLVKALVDDA